MWTNEEILTWVKEQGDKISLGSEECERWKREHNNCPGCPSELGCSKMGNMWLASIVAPLFAEEPGESEQERDYLNYFKARILRAKTKEELDGISFTSFRLGPDFRP